MDEAEIQRRVAEALGSAIIRAIVAETSMGALQQEMSRMGALLTDTQGQLAKFTAAVPDGESPSRTLGKRSANRRGPTS